MCVNRTLWWIIGSEEDGIERSAPYSSAVRGGNPILLRSAASDLENYLKKVVGLRNAALEECL